MEYKKRSIIVMFVLSIVFYIGLLFVIKLPEYIETIKLKLKYYKFRKKKKPQRSGGYADKTLGEKRF